MQNSAVRPRVAIFTGAGFSWPWGIPLANQIMEMKDLRIRQFPGQWQATLIDRVAATWNSTASIHKGIPDEFARMLQTSNNELTFEEFTAFLALRLSFHFWRIGSARETKWGTGDHVRKQKSVPVAYTRLVTALKDAELIGIVTTNYDLVVEKLLGPLHSGRLGGFNYGEPGEALTGTHAVSSRWSYKSVVIDGNVPYYKLHGSLNWALSSDHQIIKYIDSRPSRGRRYKVLLLPPVMNEVCDELKPVWEGAKHTLENAEIWVICGYSLPDYDQEVQELLRQSAKHLRRIVVLDVNPEPIQQRLKNLNSSFNSIDIQLGPGISPELDTRELSSLLQIPAI